MTSEIQVTIIQHYLVAPPPNTVSNLSVPLTFCDMRWIGLMPPFPRLVFYDQSISKSHFIDTIIPKLKISLSLALQHFPSLAGNLIIPQARSSRPEIRYVNGDSVPLMFAESDFRGFDYLVSNEARKCSDFYPLVPQLPRSSRSSGLIKVPLLAFQVTLFPGIGICIGISNHHVAGDGSSMYAFTKAWTRLYKLGEDAFKSSPGEEYLPFYDRDVMRKTRELDDLVWSDVRNRLENSSVILDYAHGLPADTDKVRATFSVRLEDVQRLKNHVVSNQSSPMKHLSTFTTVCGYVWNCLVKSGNATNDLVDENESEYFLFVADCRGRTDPPIPANYFGNCLVRCTAIAKSRQLAGEGGFRTAAELIGEAIHERLHNKQGPFHGLEIIFSADSSKVMKLEKILCVAGSPRQNYYNMDFGWGKPRKYESLSIDMTGALSLSGCRDSGGLEIGLSMPKAKMDAFATFFKEGLKAL